MVMVMERAGCSLVMCVAGRTLNLNWIDTQSKVRAEKADVAGAKVMIVPVFSTGLAARISGSSTLEEHQM